MDTAFIIKIAGVVTALSVIAGTAWAIGDYTELRPVVKREFKMVQAQMESTNKAILLLQFSILDQKRQQGALTFLETQQYCSIARELGYVNVPGCGF